MSRTQQATFAQVLEAIKANNLKVSDDHNNNREDRSIGGLAELVNKNGHRHIVGLYANTHFCLNIVYLDDETGKATISRTSVGGNINSAANGLQAGVDKYNAAQVDNQWSCGTLENVVLF